MSETFLIPQEVQNGALGDVEAACLTAVYNSMRIIRDAQRLKGFTPHGSDIKDDGSLVSATHRLSEAIAQEVFATMLPGAPFKSEEGTVTIGTSGKKRVGYDPNDGSASLAVGAPTSTVIGTVYDTDGVFGAIIGEPSTGRCFSAFGNEGTHGRLLDLDSGETLAHAFDVKTWAGGLANKGRVFIDNNRPHSHNGHATLLGEQHDQLRSLLRQRGIATMEVGSNGAHQLYVASGADRAAAAITTARGNPEDTAAGAFLVERSGGAVQRLDVVEGLIIPTRLESPGYDMLVAANNRRTLDAICGLLDQVSL